MILITDFSEKKSANWLIKEIPELEFNVVIIFGGAMTIFFDIPDRDQFLEGRTIIWLGSNDELFIVSISRYWNHGNIWALV
jgi:hypothetical protein